MRKRVAVLVVAAMLAGGAPGWAQQSKSESAAGPTPQSKIAPESQSKLSPEPVPAPKPKIAPAPVPYDDSAGTTDANARAAAKANAQTRGIVNRQAEYKALVDKNIADYDAKMDDYRRAVRENEARNAEIMRRNAERQALYKACLAKDRAACKKYDAGL